ncbi:MAG: IS982 family transposase [Cyanobacteria bacterium J06649_11]
MKIDITALFVCLDDFCKLYESSLKERALPYSGRRHRESCLSLSEIMFIEVLYHFSPFKDFKRFYKYGICTELRSCFKQLPSYQRFVALKKKLFLPMSLLLHCLMGEETGLYFADSTSLKVCRNKRIHNHKTFEGLAQRGKTTMGWFFGLKLHLIVNHKGQLMAIKITPGNTDDRKALLSMVKDLKGKCFADKGYIGKDLFKTLWNKGLHLITGIRRNMRNHLMPYIDKILLRKRFIIETIFGVLKTEMNLEHSRHRSPINAFVTIMAALVAYSYKTNKPKIKAFLINP